MSFPVTVMVSSSPKNAFTKTTTTIGTYNGVLKEDTSIIDPILLLNVDFASMTNANYLYVPAFHRYYFINNIISARGNLTSISAHVDVLASYKDAILNNSAIIRRQEKGWNLYINDGVFRVYQNPLVQTKEFPQGFTSGTFVLAVAGR